MNYINHICVKAKVSNLISNSEDEIFKDIYKDELDTNPIFINHETKFPNSKIEFINKYKEICGNNSYVSTVNLINELSEKISQMVQINTEMVSYINGSFNKKHFVVSQQQQKDLASVVSSIILIASDMRAIKKISNDKIRVISNLSLMVVIITRLFLMIHSVEQPR